MRDEAEKTRTKIKGFPSHAFENNGSKERKSRNPNIKGSCIDRKQYQL